jgi:hypothetical protein
MTVAELLRAVADELGIHCHHFQHLQSNQTDSPGSGDNSFPKVRPLETCAAALGV